jgi:hypothetical protein
MSDPDLFGNTPSQADMFADHRPGPRKIMDFQGEARRRLEAALAEAKAADSMPWGKRELEKWQILFPQMAGWLPDDEANQLCFEFAREIERLKNAA